MQLADLPQVMSIERSAYSHPWTQGNFSDSIASGYDTFVMRGRMDEQTMLGYAVLMWLPDEVHLLNITIAREWQGKGLGGQLLAKIYKNLHDRGAAAVMLEVRESNLGAQRLYATNGFRPIGVRKGYYPLSTTTRESAIVLKKLLSERL